MIVVTGPESTGKTTLVNALAQHAGAGIVEECARHYLSGSNPSYLPSDLLRISQMQSAREDEVRGGSSSVIADTDLQVIYIWWQERFGPAPGPLVRAYAQQSLRRYLLCAPDIDWAPDPLREHPQDRERLFERYRADLDARGLDYRIVTGRGEARIAKAIELLSEFASAHPVP